MSISILNEWSYTQDTQTSDIVSVQMPLNLYYKATKTGVASSIVKLYNGIVPDLNLYPVLIDEDSTDYYYYVDLHDVAKYYFKNIGVNDDLEIMSASGLQASSLTKYITLGIYTYDSLDVLVESISNVYYFSHLTNNIPTKYGFNLWEMMTIRNMPRYMKWSNDTYNALFLFVNGANVTIKNHTNGHSYTGLTVAGMRQFKFDKRIQEKFGVKNYANVDLIDGAAPANAIVVNDDVSSATAKLSKITFNDDDNSVKRIYFEALQPTSAPLVPPVKHIINNVNDDIRRYHELQLDNLDGLGVGFIGLDVGQHSGGSTIHHIDEDIRVEIEYNKDTSSYILLEPGKNAIEIIVDNGGSPAINFGSTEIEYDPYCDYINLLWMHPSYGYVSYPFEGASVESNEVTGIGYVKDFITTLVNVNSLTSNNGYNSNEIITITTNAESKYYELLKSIYDSRNVYVYVGERGDEDSELVWVKCEIKGNYIINKNRNSNATNFTVQIKLQPKQTIKF